MPDLHLKIKAHMQKNMYIYNSKELEKGKKRKIVLSSNIQFSKKTANALTHNQKQNQPHKRHQKHLIISLCHFISLKNYD